MTLQEMAALWPYDVTDFSKGKATYAAQNVTVARVFNNAQGLGLKFSEDPTPDGDRTGVIWNIQGEWDNEANAPGKYNGFVPAQGEKLSVTLTVKQGDSRVFRDCKIATEDRFDDEGGRHTAPVQPPASPGEAEYDDPAGPGPQPTEPAAVQFRDPTRESIEKQVATKEYGAMLIAMHGMTAVREIAENAGAEIEPPLNLFTHEQLEWMAHTWLDLVYELQHGRPPQEQPE